MAEDLVLIEGDLLPLTTHQTEDTGMIAEVVKTEELLLNSEAGVIVESVKI